MYAGDDGTLVRWFKGKKDDGKKGATLKIGMQDSPDKNLRISPVEQRKRKSIPGMNTGVPSKYKIT